MKKHLNIMYAADNNYAPFLGISLFSLYENNKDIDLITIYAVLDNVSGENKNRLIKMSEIYGREIRIVNADEVRSLMEELGVPKYRGSYATHYRKFFNLLIDDDVERLLYIDSDSIVCGSLKTLIDVDMGEACVGVVLDALCNRYKLLLGFQPEETYFNAGVTLINVPNWKKYKCDEILKDHIKNTRAKYCNPDQDLFNLALRGKTMVLPPEYNFMPVHRAYSDKAYNRCYGFENYYTVEQINNARKRPVILHTYRFIGEFPWHKGNVHPDNDIFDRYKDKSPWKDYEKITANVNTVFKIEKIIYRIIPGNLFLFVFSRFFYFSFKRKNKKLNKQ